LIRPTSGKLLIGGQNLNDLPQAVIGRSVGYVDSNPGIVNGTVFDNLVYGLKHNPHLMVASADDRAGLQSKWRTEALAAGNSTEDANADWVDLDAANADTSVELISRALDALDVAGLKPALAEFGLRTRIDPDQESVALSVASPVVLHAHEAMRRQDNPEPRHFQAVRPPRKGSSRV